MTTPKGNPKHLVLILALLAFTFPTWASGQDYPTRAITFHCGYEAGGGTDVATRALAKGVEEILRVPVVVINKPGGGASLATSAVANMKPDGYNFGAVSSGPLASRPHLFTYSYDPMKDFTYVCKFGQYFGAIVVLGESPLKAIDEFIAYAKKHPGLKYTSSGMYSLANVAIDVFAKHQGVKFNHVPCKGGAEATKQLLGKHVDFTGGAGTHLSFVKTGQLRQLLMFGMDKRHPDFPDVPIMKELGTDDPPGLANILIGPRGIPESIVKKVVDACRKTSEMAKYQETVKLVALPAYSEGKEFEAEIRAEYNWYKKYFDSVGIKKKQKEE
jgi:tripartite-type tricarboxylate transporter receptor subunit TctC